MGFFSKAKSSLTTDMIRCDESEYLIWKWRPAGMPDNSTTRENCIKSGSQLRVKDGEVAAFVYSQANGTCQDFIVGPYDEILQTENLPGFKSMMKNLMLGVDGNIQAEVYFINTAGNIQIRFAIPYFDVFDPRFEELPVPVAVRGSITFNITDYQGFVKLNRLVNFDLTQFQKQVKDAVTKYVKSVVVNAPLDGQIRLVQIERKTLEINDMIAPRVKDLLENDFGVNMKRFDISAIEIDKESENYIELKSMTTDAANKMTKAQQDIQMAQVDLQRSQVDLQKSQLEAQKMDIFANQRMDSQNREEMLRIQREEMQRQAKLQTESNFMNAHALNQQSELLKAAINNADALGENAQLGLGAALSNITGGMGGMNQMAQMNKLNNTMGGMKSMDTQMGGMNGMNPQMGGMNGMNQQMGGINGMNPMGGMNQMGQAPGMPGTPPPPPSPADMTFMVLVNGQQSGPFNISLLQQMAMGGQINANTYVWRQGMANWVLAGQVPELAALFGAPACPPPPMP